MRSTRRGEDGRFLALARSMRDQIREFSEAVKPSSDEEPRVDPRVRESELRVAIEELRAQNEALFEACTRLGLEMAKYRDLYDGAPDALVTTDGRGVILDANPAAATLLGVEPEVLGGKLLISFVARGDTPSFRERLRGIARGEGQGDISVQIRPRGGRPLEARLTVRAVKDSALATTRERQARVVFHWTLRVDAPSGATTPRT